MVDTHSHRYMIAVSEHLPRACRLERTTVAVGRRPVAVNFTEEGARRNVIGRRLIDIDGGHAVADAQLAGERSTGITWLPVGAVAVDVALPETTIVADALHRECVGRLPTASRFEEGELKMG